MNTSGHPENSGAAQPAAVDAGLNHEQTIVVRGGVANSPSANATSSTLRVRCPHCHNLIDTVGEGSLSDIRCGSCGNSFNLVDPDVETREAIAPRMLGHFQLLERLGVGAFGEVWRARDQELDRTVAIKLPRKGRLDSSEAEKFLREARAAAQLRHPNIVAIHEVGRDGDTVYIVSDLIHGVSLADWLTGRRPTARRAAEICRTVAEALHHAHEKGVVHRDLKPANILVDRDDQPHVTDFGLAKRDTGELTMTLEGQVLGTPAYMSPEQARGEGHEVDRRADVYSLGVILFELLTGERPFRGTVQMIMHQAIHDEPPRPRALNHLVPRDLETICLKCLQKDAARRYPSAAELGDDLRRFLAGEAIHARPAGFGERVWRWCRRKPAVAASLLAAGATLVTLVVLALVTAQLRLSRQIAENRRLELGTLEKEAELRESKLEATQRLVATQRRISATHEFYSLLNGARERAAIPQPGWAQAGLRDVTKAAALEDAVANTVELRTEAIRFLTGIDVAQVARVPIDTFHRAYLTQFHPNGRWLAVAMHKDWLSLGIKLCEVPSGIVIHELSAPCAKLWQLRNNKQDAVHKIAFTNDGNSLAMVTRSGWLHRWDLTQTPPVLSSAQLPADPPPEDIALDPSAHRLFFVAHDGGVELWPDCSTRETQKLSAGPSGVSWLDVSPDGQRVLMHNRRQLVILDSASLSPTFVSERAETPIRLSRSGALLAYMDEGRIIVADPLTGSTIRSLEDPAIGSAHDGRVTQIEFSPSGTLLVSSGHDRKLKLWDVTSGDIHLSVVVSGSGNIHCAFSPDERYLAATADSEAVVYELLGLSLARSTAQDARPIRTFEIANGLVLTASSGRHRSSVFLSARDIDNGPALEQWSLFGVPASTDLSACDRGSLVVASSARTDTFHAWTLSPERVAQAKKVAAAVPTMTNSIGPSPSVLLFYRDQYARVDPQTKSVVGPLGSIAQFGLAWDQIDAAVNVGDGRIFLFRGDQCAALDVASLRPMAGYPRAISDEFPGIWTSEIDAAFRAADDAIVFFKKGQFYRWDLRVRRVEGAVPRDIANHWKGSPFDHFDATYNAFDDKQTVWFFRAQEGVPYDPDTEQFGAQPRRLDELFRGLGWESLDAAVDLSANTAPVRLSSNVLEIAVQGPEQIHISPDGKSASGVIEGGVLATWNLPAWSERHRWANHLSAKLLGKGDLTAVTAGTEWNLAGDGNGQIMLFSAAGGPPRKLWLAPHRITALTLSPDESLAICGASDGSVYLIRVPDGEKLEALSSHHDTVSSFSFSDDGALLATASHDRSIRLLQRRGASFEPLFVLRGGLAPMERVRLTPDGRRLLALRKGETALRTWHLDALRQRLEGMHLGW